MTDADVDDAIYKMLSPMNVSYMRSPRSATQARSAATPPAASKCSKCSSTAGIEIHAQIVLCPGLNDGDELLRARWRYVEAHPGLRASVSCPLGFTKHQKRFAILVFPRRRGVSRRRADAEPLPATRLHDALVRRVFQLADEFYIDARAPRSPGGYLRRVTRSFTTASACFAASSTMRTRCCATRARGLSAAASCLRLTAAGLSSSAARRPKAPSTHSAAAFAPCGRRLLPRH